MKGRYKDMKNEREIIVLTALIVMSFLGTSIGVGAGPTIGEITLSPPKPTPRSTVTFSVNISGDSPSGVWLVVEECNGNTGVCYPYVNVSMDEVSAGRYQKNVTLMHEDATYITSKVLVESGSNWFNSSKKTILSSEVPDGNQNGNGNNDKKTPGFELVPFLLAVALGMLLFRRKRLR